VPFYAVYNYSLRFANQVSEKGAGKPHAQSVDFQAEQCVTILAEKAYFAGQESL
jgi:hypothetical protein